MSRSVHSILSDTKLDQEQRVRLLKRALQYTDRLDDALLTKLKQGLLGWYGTEYFLNPDGFGAVVDFFSWLRDRYPGSAQVTAILGDALILDGQQVAGFNRLVEALRLDGNTTVPGEFADLLHAVGTEQQRLEVDLAYVRSLLGDNRWDEARAELVAVKTRYDSDMVTKTLAEEPYLSDLIALNS